MKIVFNTKYPDSASAMFYMSGMKDIPTITFSDYENYSEYEIALFMTYKQDLEDLKKAKLSNPLLKVGLLDPRGSQVEKYLQYVDFLVLDSIEMKDFFSKYHIPIHTYYEYANVPMLSKKHQQKETVILGYHGNKVHLTAMFPEITSAIEQLSQQYNIEFWAMYNIEHLGRWNIGLPKDVKVRHIQWSMENYEKTLSQVDIGLVPACMPIQNLPKVKLKTRVSRFFAYSLDDYLIRFKMPSNPGRIIIFAKLGIPVVADFLPSNIQFVKDEENGMLAYSTGGWYQAIEKLIKSPELRQRLSDNMLKTYHQYFDYTVQNEKFLKFLQEISVNKNMTTIEKRTSWIENLKFHNAYLWDRVYHKIMKEQ